MDDPHYNRLYSSGSSARPSAGRLDQARQLAAQQRDAALLRLGSARRWVIAGAAGLSAGFAALVYLLAPGHSLTSARAATPQEGSSTSTLTSQRGQPQLPAPAGPAALGLAGGGGSASSDDGGAGGSASGAPAPAQSNPAPAPAPSSPPVTSGGS